mgnify:CR=1 FL=1
MLMAGTRFLHFCGATSLEIYLCHQYIFSAFRQNVSVNPYITLLCAMLVSIAVAFIIKQMSGIVSSVIVSKN